MPRFAIIDKESGFIWGVQDAEDAIAACRKLDLSNQDADREYEENPNASLYNADGGYVVYLAPDDYTVDDGQDQAAINEVRLMPLAACVDIIWTGDDYS